MVIDFCGCLQKGNFLHILSDCATHNLDTKRAVMRDVRHGVQRDVERDNTRGALNFRGALNQVV